MSIKKILLLKEAGFFYGINFCTLISCSGVAQPIAIGLYNITLVNSLKEKIIFIHYWVYDNNTSAGILNSS